MQLTPFCLMLSCLRVSPDRSQFFWYESITLSSPPAFIENTYPTDSGVYWCESKDREMSNGVNITITGQPVILESPALPVLEGAAVILRCKAETSSFDQSISGGGESLSSWLAVEGRTVILESPTLPVLEGDAVILRCKAEVNSINHRFNFFKNDLCISSNSTGQMTIHSASKSDEGFYKCSISGGGESLSSWLAVENSSSVSVIRLICHLVVGTPYLLSTILLGIICRDRKRAARLVAERRGSNDVIMEIAV
ncbi:hypothetical protein D5F01_LYC23054 [Larimichthys crocea]|uniref:Ig-like domain-containing protein n=1 Tax=Larimichthys crocea TaxID=215358 RepID=A0A6G0HJU8_LARCR|nr:hypothetical protein D5F01_LYC23054 [Larimichthys crocea]